MSLVGALGEFRGHSAAVDRFQDAQNSDVIASSEFDLDNPEITAVSSDFTTANGQRTPPATHSLPQQIETAISLVLNGNSSVVSLLPILMKCIDLVNGKR